MLEAYGFSGDEAELIQETAKATPKLRFGSMLAEISARLKAKLPLRKATVVQAPKVNSIIQAPEVTGDGIAPSNVIVREQDDVPPELNPCATYPNVGTIKTLPKQRSLAEEGQAAEGVVRQRIAVPGAGKRRRVRYSDFFESYGDLNTKRPPWARGSYLEDERGA